MPLTLRHKEFLFRNTYIPVPGGYEKDLYPPQTAPYSLTLNLAGYQPNSDTLTDHLVSAL